MNIKQLFCKHIYKTEDIVIIKVIDKGMYNLLGKFIPTKKEIQEAVYETCVKCSKHKISQQSRFEESRK
jgi:hypothetical protein